jgi:hydroxymethylbilane synthase
MMNRMRVFRLDASSADALRRASAADAAWRARACEALRARLAPREAEAILLATCERAELILLDGSDAGSTLLDALGTAVGAPLAYESAWHGLAALERLFRLAAGLESRIVGEDHIRRQLIDAVEVARSGGLCGASLGRIADRALHAARRARATSGLGRLGGSYANAAADCILATVAERESDAPLELTIFGTGMLARDLVAALHGRAEMRIAILSRHRERAEAAFAGSELRVIDWAEGSALHDALERSDIFVAATTSPRPLLSAARHGSRRVAPLLIDLGAPAVTDPAFAERTRLVTLAELGHREVERAAIEEAEAIVAASLARTVERIEPTALLLATHGAGDGSEANLRALDLAERLRAGRSSGAVGVGFRRGTPGFAEEFTRIARRANSVTVVPIMTSAGYFAREVLPAALAGPAREASATLRFAEPLGTLVAPRRAMVERALERVRRGDIGRVIVVGHGTERSNTSGDSARELAAMIRRELVACDASVPVETAFLDQEPRIDAACERGAPDGRRTLLVPFLWGGGGHERVDLFDELIAHCPALDAIESFGRSPAIEQAVRALDRAHTPGRTLRLGTRASRLALRQAEIAAVALRTAGYAVRIVTMSTIGDRDLERPIEAFGIDGPFTDELELALTNDACDIAVHSLKDLPLTTADGVDRGELALTQIAGVLERASAAETLVTFDGRPLSALPEGATVGTSSVRRTAQLRALRPDLRPVGIRGPVDARIEQVRARRFDAAVLAEAGVDRLGAMDAIAERWPIETFVPEAAQGAIALTARRDDAPACAACRLVDDRRTHEAVRLERRIARAIEGGALRATGRAVVAAVHCGRDLVGEVRVRTIDRASGAMRDVVIERDGHSDRADLVRDAIRSTRRAWMREVV